MEAQPPSPSGPQPLRAEVSVMPGAGGRSTAPLAAANFEKVIPLLHAPDDPGPDAEPQTEPQPDPPPPPPDGWGWLRELFR